MPQTNDPELYRQLSAPFDTAEEANTALVAFFADVRAARIKHRMPDVLTVVAVNVRYQDDRWCISLKFDGGTACGPELSKGAL